MHSACLLILLQSVGFSSEACLLRLLCPGLCKYIQLGQLFAIATKARCVSDGPSIVYNYIKRHCEWCGISKISAISS